MFTSPRDAVELIKAEPCATPSHNGGRKEGNAPRIQQGAFLFLDQENIVTVPGLSFARLAGILKCLNL